jgi:hypothetical protein
MKWPPPILGVPILVGTIGAILAMEVFDLQWLAPIIGALIAVGTIAAVGAKAFLRPGGYWSAKWVIGIIVSAIGFVVFTMLGRQ